MTTPAILSLFTGIGGIELGFAEADYGHVIATYEVWPAARNVLRSQFPDVAHHHDVAELTDFHGAEIVTAGFPCTDLSQAGRTTGIDGIASGLVRRVLDTLSIERPRWLLLENVPNMLHLGVGQAIYEIVGSLQSHGYTWAYRVIDSRSFGLAQRRRRVYLLASTDHDPGTVLFGEDAGPVTYKVTSRSDAFGFSWTEGNPQGSDDCPRSESTRCMARRSRGRIRDRHPVDPCRRGTPGLPGGVDVGRAFS